MPLPDATKSRPPNRLAYIDWMRGLACLLMFQTHCYDSWLGGAARQGDFFMYSQLGGTFPAPLFLFLAGISFALVTDKLWQKNLAPGQIARTTIWRGAEIVGYGLLFRVQEYVVAWGWAPKTDLLRVDVLNTIGLSMMLLGVMCWMAGAISLIARHIARHGEGDPSLPRPSSLGQGHEAMPRVPLILASASTAMLISLLTPPVWTTWRPTWLPWPIESYVDGVHNLGVPQQGIFPIFPWTAFAFAGLAVGFVLQSEWARDREARVFVSVGVAGALLIEFARWLDRQPRQLYAVYDYWHTSPSFFLIRVGMLMVILTASYAWCRWGFARPSNAWWRFSPLIVLGQASLLVYWVHIEFVYGRVSILPKRGVGIRMASVGLLVIFVAMLALAYYRTKMKGRGAEVFAWLRPNPARAS